MASPWRNLAENTSRVININIPNNGTNQYHVPPDGRPWEGHSIPCVVFLPKRQSPNLITRKHQANLIQGKFHKTTGLSSSKIFMSWNTKRDWGSSKLKYASGTSQLNVIHAPGLQPGSGKKKSYKDHLRLIGKMWIRSVAKITALEQCEIS